MMKKKRKIVGNTIATIVLLMNLKHLFRQMFESKCKIGSRACPHHGKRTCIISPLLKLGIMFQFDLITELLQNTQQPRGQASCFNRKCFFVLFCFWQSRLIPEANKTHEIFYNIELLFSKVPEIHNAKVIILLCLYRPLP